MSERQNASAQQRLRGFRKVKVERFLKHDRNAARSGEAAGKQLSRSLLRPRSRPLLPRLADTTSACASSAARCTRSKWTGRALSCRSGSWCWGRPRGQAAAPQLPGAPSMRPRAEAFRPVCWRSWAERGTERFAKFWDPVWGCLQIKMKFMPTKLWIWLVTCDNASSLKRKKVGSVVIFHWFQIVLSLRVKIWTIIYR